jgi:hypothetical protein
LVLLVVAAAAAVFALAASAQAAKSKPTGVTFVLLSGPHAGERVKTDGGPNVPARLNGGRIRGRLIPQSEGNEFTFKGTVRARGRARAQAADNTKAAALPEKALSGVVREVAAAITAEEGARKGIVGSVNHVSLQLGTVPFLDRAKKMLGDLRAAQQLSDPPYGDLIARLNKAADLDRAAQNKNDKANAQPPESAKQNALKKEAVADLEKAIAEKEKVLTALTELAIVAAIFPDEPPTTPVTQPPTPVEPPTLPPNAVFVPAAINSNSTEVAGTENPGTPDSTAAVFDETTGRFIVEGPAGSSLDAFGPGGTVGGQVQGSPGFVSSPFFSGEQPTLLPTGQGGTGGDVRGGDSKWFVGFVSLAKRPFEQAAAWFRKLSRPRARASALSFSGLKVRAFAGGSSLFTVSGDTAFGDHFDRGISGTYRAFRVDLNSGVLTELFRPAGGSSQPRASNATGLAAGASVYSNGARRATYWWGNQHYLRFASSNTIVSGINDAGVGVGLIGPLGNFHAALFEHGKVYDLNTLIPAGSGWTLTAANAISNAGVIVGAGILNGQQRGFVLNLSSKRP